MGSEIVRVIAGKSGLELAGAFARRTERGGLDLGTAAGLERELGIAVGNDLPSVLSAGRPQIAIQATSSTIADAIGEISTLIGSGVHVISIAEEMTYPAATSAALARRLDELALEHGVTLLGTGVNPGFVLDLLIVALSGVCTDVRRLSARRTNDLAHYGHAVMKAQGVGLTREEFTRRVESGAVVGHIGFRQSIHMIAAAVGWDIDRIVETRDPIIARTARETPLVRVAPGRVAGCLHTAVGYVRGDPVVELVHPQQVQPQREDIETSDTIEIRGTPDVRLELKPEIPGATATAALAVNMIPRTLNADPGLHSMVDLPVPSVMNADVRLFLKPTRGGSA
jgi:4-hydroxy-tetrahydrodipicolinate reductase